MSEQISIPDGIDGEKLAWPCGYTGKYLFNDRLTWIADAVGRLFNVTIDDTNIALSVDRDVKFKRNEERSKVSTGLTLKTSTSWSGTEWGPKPTSSSSTEVRKALC